MRHSWSSKTRLAQARQMLPRSTVEIVEIVDDLEEIEAPGWFRDKMRKLLVTVAEEVNGIAEEHASERLHRAASAIASVMPDVEGMRRRT